MKTVARWFGYAHHKLGKSGIELAIRFTQETIMANQIISRVRRNHGLEHATIHMLSKKHTGFSAQGHSDHRGFHLNIYGDIKEEDVVEAVEEAYKRLKAGQHHLAVHPNCGTVLLTTATMATLAAQASLGLEQKRQRSDKMNWSVLMNGLPTAVLAVILSLIISKPVGIYLQANFTTDGDLGDMKIKSIRKIAPSPITRLFQLLLTGGRKQLKATAYKIETVG
jgi:S-ribosylhomocysteine lyase LuxS involved in autoinducer biosynthesis